MNRRQLQLLLCLSWCSCCCVQLGDAARVYMEFNGQHYAYNTDNLAPTKDLSPNYEVPRNWPQSSNRLETAPNRIAHSQQWGWTQPQYAANLAATAAPTGSTRNIDFSTQQMSHTQHTDEAGHVLGKYSYYDDAGYHELSYKAGAGIGFVVMGGNLAKPTEQSEVGHNNLAIA